MGTPSYRRDGPLRRNSRLLFASLIPVAAGLGVACLGLGSSPPTVKHELAIAIHEADEFHAANPGPFQDKPCSYDPEAAQADCGGDVRYLLRPTIREQSTCRLLSDDHGPLALTCMTSEGERVFVSVARISR